MKNLICAAIGAFVSALPVRAALTLSYGNQTGGNTYLRDNNGVPLTSGTKAVDGDGAIIQIGYYSLATTSDPFAGNWVALAGPGTGVETKTVGDLNGTPGIVGGNAVLAAKGPGSGSYPVISTPIVIRFYNGTSLASSTHYNAVTLSDWYWLSPTTDNGILLAIWDASLIPMTWEGGSGSAFRTTLPNVVPEPSVFLISVISGSAFVWRRKRC